MKKVLVFPDTNAFIQLRDLKDLPWLELFPEADEVCLLIARSVVQELDKHKVSTNSRRRDRARAALKLIDAASESSDRSIVLRDKSVRVVLNVPKRIKPEWDHWPELEPAAPDDQLVAAAATFGNGAVLLSHDSGPRISARDIGLLAIDPPTSWLLPLEQSDHERKIGRLERELKQARSKSPEISITFPQSDGEGPITLYRYQLLPLEQHVIDALAYAHIRANPKSEPQASNFQMGVSLGGPSGFTPEDVARYNHDYSLYASQVHDYFAKLHKGIAKLAGVPKLLFTITNVGGGSASKLVVSMIARGEFGLLADRDRNDVAGDLSLPKPPRPRMASQDAIRNLMQGVFEPPSPAQGLLDPTEINWLERPKMGDTFGSYGCEDFRPGRGYDDAICLWPNELPAHGTIEVVASAEHMPEVTNSREVRIEDQSANWTDPAVLAILPAEVRDHLTEHF